MMTLLFAGFHHRSSEIKCLTNRKPCSYDETLGGSEG
jgi:hypothetical protein